MLKPNSSFPKPEIFAALKQNEFDPYNVTSAMISDVTSEKLAPATAINRGLLHKLCKHGLNKCFSSLFEAQKFASGINAKYKGRTVSRKVSSVVII